MCCVCYQVTQAGDAVYCPLHGIVFRRRRPRRSRAQVDADALATMLERWDRHLTVEETSAGHCLLHALRELEDR